MDVAEGEIQIEMEANNIRKFTNIIKSNISRMILNILYIQIYPLEV